MRTVNLLSLGGLVTVNLPQLLVLVQPEHLRLEEQVHERPVLLLLELHKVLPQEDGRGLRVRADARDTVELEVPKQLNKVALEDPRDGIRLLADGNTRKKLCRDLGPNAPRRRLHHVQLPHCLCQSHFPKNSKNVKV